MNPYPYFKMTQTIFRNQRIAYQVLQHLPYLAGLGPPVIVSIAGRDHDEFVRMAARLDGLPGIAALELNISCPNVCNGVDYGTDPARCQGVVAGAEQGAVSEVGLAAS